MSDVLNVEIRPQRGKRRNRRLRKDGFTPAVLYGHGEEVISLSVPTGEMAAAIRHGAKLVDLRGAVKEQALIRELQWDAFGVDVLHADFTRVSAGERVQVKLQLEFRGEATGVREGGVLEHLVHDVEIEGSVMAIPEKLELNVNTLNLGDSLNVSQIELPEGAIIISDDNRTAVQCNEPVVAEEEEEAEAPDADAAEPEVIGRKAEDEEEAEGK